MSYFIKIWFVNSLRKRNWKYCKKRKL